MFKILHLMTKIAKTDAGSAPEWMLLFKAGWGRLDDGSKFLVDKKAFDLIQAGIKTQGNEIHFDYEHASVMERATLANGAPAAGWIKELTWEDGVGIKVRVEWTNKAAAHIASREYRYFSPVFGVHKKDLRVCYLDSVALTNRPKTSNLTPILAALEARLEEPKEDIMDRKKLIAALGLASDATDKEILVAIAALGIKMPESEPAIPSTVIAALGLEETDGESVVVASIHALNQAKENGVSVEDFNALKKEISDKKATDLVAAAMKAGKVPPSQKDWALDYAKKDLDGFKVYVAKAPVVVPVDDLGDPPEGGADGKVSDAVLKVAAMMDVDAEDLKTG